jgi:glucokinase-like ROK family protein
VEPKTWNQQVVKRNNKSLVLQFIIRHEPISRADIAQMTGLNKATVSSLVNELLEEELVYESGPGESSGGRRPVLLHFHKTAGFSIGIDIGVNYLLGILTDLRGNIIYEKNQPLEDSSYLSVMKMVHEFIYTILNNIPKSRYGAIGIGIGVPGIVDREGTVLLAPNLGWKNVNIKVDIEKEFNLPVIVENEANAGAYGEKQFGAGQHYQNIIYISAGIGLGAGLILNGELFQGKNGFSGELGHMIIHVNGRPCGCGSKGCWETYSSEDALLKRANIPEASLESLIQAADQGDISVIELFDEIGIYLGLGINNIINTFNPELIVIGNRLAKAKNWLDKHVQNTILHHTLPFHQKEVEVCFSKLSIYPAALGVSAFAAETFINSENIRNGN